MSITGKLNSILTLPSQKVLVLVELFEVWFLNTKSPVDQMQYSVGFCC